MSFIEEQDREFLNSWIIFTIKDVMGVEDVRNDILKYFLQTLPQHNIEYGPTFSIGVPKEKLYKYLDFIITPLFL